MLNTDSYFYFETFRITVFCRIDSTVHGTHIELTCSNLCVIQYILYGTVQYASATKQFVTINNTKHTALHGKTFL